MQIPPRKTNMLEPGEPDSRYQPLSAGYDGYREAIDLESHDFLALLRRYALLGVLMLILGIGLGALSVVLQRPVYRAQTMLEFQATPEPSAMFQGFQADRAPDQVYIQTQIRVLTAPALLNSVLTRMQTETFPPAPFAIDIFSKLRLRFFPDARDPMTLLREGVDQALASFEARPVNGTRIVELMCESSSAEIAANFVNLAADEFIQQTLQSRMQERQQAAQHLGEQLEETRFKLQEAEQRLQDFVRKSGNIFVTQENTLADTKLRQLQGELSTIQADRIAKQARYELARTSAPESLPDVLDDENLRAYQAQLTQLRREYAALNATLTPRHYKVQKVAAQIAQLEAVYQQDVKNVLQRIKNDYETALRREKLLTAAHATQAGQVSVQAVGAADYNALRREVDTLRQTYSSMLAQVNQASMMQSTPFSNVRVVNRGSPSHEPYRPKPVLNIGFGIIAGLFLTGGIAYFRERADQSLKGPGEARRWVNLPELGVIPSAILELPRLKRTRELLLPGNARAAAPTNMTASAVWDGKTSILAESFRFTLASILSEGSDGQRPKIVLFTSPGPGEGKSTMVAHLGVALAETGKRVLVVDADLRRPRLHRVFDVPNDEGLSTLLNCDLSGLQQGSLGIPSRFPGLYVIPSGPPPLGVVRVLYSERLKSLFEQLRAQFDAVLVDAPPMLQFVDARLLGKLADGVVLVLRVGMTHRLSAQDACRRLASDGLVVLGTVLNDWTPSDSAGRHYYRYYEYYRKHQGRDNG